MRPGRLAVLFAVGGLLTGCGATSVSTDGAAPPPTLTAAPTVPASPVPPTVAWYTTESPPYNDGPETPATPYSTVTDQADQPCPPGGLTSSVGFTDAAMGLRWVRLTVKNCGSVARTVRGYPDLAVVDEFQRPLDVTVKHGEAGSDGTPLPAPRSFRLKPGKTLMSALTWRNTVTMTVENDRMVKAGGVLITTGELEQIFMAYLDVGSSGNVFVSPWATKLD
jgi:hypothetical protein